MSTLEPSSVHAVAAMADGDWQMSVATGAITSVPAPSRSAARPRRSASEMKYRSLT